MYYKKNGIVIKSPVAPITIDKHKIRFINDEGMIHSYNLSTGFSSVDSEIDIIPLEINTWEEATQVEYLIHQSLNLNLILNASRDVRASIWALNKANSDNLRLGIAYPVDKKPINISSLSDKFSIVSQTQHWYSDDRPDIDNVTNSQFTDWIVKKRKQEEFIYIGSQSEVEMEVVN